MFNKIFITVDGGKGTKKLRKQMKKWFIMLNTKIDALMRKQERFDAILAGMNDVTNQIAADYAAFVEEVRAGTVSDDSLAKAEANVATLKQIAASNDQPLPGTDIPPVTEGGEATQEGQDGAGAAAQG